MVNMYFVRIEQNTMFKFSVHLVHKVVKQTSEVVWRTVLNGPFNSFIITSLWSLRICLLQISVENQNPIFLQKIREENVYMHKRATLLTRT